LPTNVYAKGYTYDHDRSKLILDGTRPLFKVDYLREEEGRVGAVTELWRWRILTSLAETVALMHSANLVHGDLSHRNVLARQVDDSHMKDEVYLIDIDDAFLDDGVPIRDGRYTFPMFDPWSRPWSEEFRLTSKATDVFVVALWTVGMVQRDYADPISVAKNGVPDIALEKMNAMNPELARLVTAALGPIEGRPTMLDLYRVIHNSGRFENRRVDSVSWNQVRSYVRKTARAFGRRLGEVWQK
jgi:hypothetical protein